MAVVGTPREAPPIRGTPRGGPATQFIPPPTPTGVTLGDVGRGIVDTAKGIGKIGKMFIPAIAKGFQTTGGILGEGLAYATDKNVREQYEAGNLDILPTITKTTQKDLWKDTGAAMLETAVLMSFPKVAQMTLKKRFGAGALQGVGAAIAAGVAEDKSPEEIVKSLPAYGVGGGVISTMSPYFLPILRAQMGKVTPEIKNMFTGIAQEVKTPGIKPPVMPEVPPASAQIISEDGTPSRTPKTIQAEDPTVQRTAEPVDVVRTTDEFQSITAQKFRQEAIRRGLPDPGEVPIQKVQKQVDQWRKADEITKDPEQGLKMLRGEADVPDGLNDGDILASLRARVLDDIEYAKANPGIVSEIQAQSSRIGTEAGRGLKALDRPVGDDDPFRAMDDVIAARQARAGRQMNIKDAKARTKKVKSDVEELKKDMTKQQLKLSEAQKLIDEIRIC
jgi:hypothetical protein